jgi:hypothetical protein
MTGAVDEAGQTARATVSALEKSPVMLALVVLQALTIGAILYNALKRQDAVTDQFTKIYALLDKCLGGHLDQKTTLPLPLRPIGERPAPVEDPPKPSADREP